MARVKTFTNGGTYLPGDLNDMQDDYERAFSTWKTIERFAGEYGNTGTDLRFLRGVWSSGGTVMPETLEGADGDGGMIAAYYLDPADLDAGNREVKLRMRCITISNNRPQATMTFSLHRLLTVHGGTAGESPRIGTITGSLVSVAVPPADPLSTSLAVTDAITLTTAGLYLLGVTRSDSMIASGANTLCTAYLQFQQA